MTLFILFMLTNMEMSDCVWLFTLQLIYTGVASFAPATALQAGNCNTQVYVIINVYIAKHVLHL